MLKPSPSISTCPNMTCSAPKVPMIHFPTVQLIFPWYLQHIHYKGISLAFRFNVMIMAVASSYHHTLALSFSCFNVTEGFLQPHHPLSCWNVRWRLSATHLPSFLCFDVMEGFLQPHHSPSCWNIRQRGFLPPTHPSSRVSMRQRASYSPTTLPHIKMWDRGVYCHSPTLLLMFWHDRGLSSATPPLLTSKCETEELHPPSLLRFKLNTKACPFQHAIQGLLISIFII